MRRWARTLEWFLVALGLLMVGVYIGGRIHQSVLSHAEAQRFKDSVLLSKELDGGPEALGKKPNFSLWSTKRIQAYEDSLANHFAPALALLRIPKIDLEVPILEGTDDLSLNRAVGHIVGTPRPGEVGNIAIAGHRDGFFRGLKDISTGDTIEIVTAGGVNKYVVDKISVVDPTDVSVLSATAQPSITLVTCYPFYFIGSAPQRYIVQGSLITSGAKKVEITNNKPF